MAITGGANMARILAEITANVEGRALVRVGFQDGMKYPSATGNPVYVAQVAFWNEYGTQGSKQGGPIPPRPFFRSMIAAKSPKWGENVGRLLAANGYNVREALALAGGKIVEQLQDSIKNGGWQKNAARTVSKKGFATPLMDSGVMWRDAITSVVVEGEE